MDPALLRRLEARRGVVDSEGTEWETRPEESSADVQGNVTGTPEARSNYDSKGGAGPAQSNASGSRASTSGHQGGYSASTRKSGPSNEEFMKRLQARRDVVDNEGSEWETRPEESSADARAAADWSAVEQGGMLATVRYTPGDSAGTSGCKFQPGEEATAESELTPEELKAKRKQMIEKERAALAADCARRWPSLLQVSEVETEAEEELDPEDLSAMRADVERTRTADPAFKDGKLQARLEFLLTDFCQKENVHYTQGLHEIAAVFAFVESMAPEGHWKEKTACLCLRALVKRFVPYYNDGEAFVALHVSLLFFRQLLLYHFPEIHIRMEEAGMPSIGYATPWFLTLFAARTPLSVLLRFWDRYLTCSTPTFLPFVAVAMLLAEKPAVMEMQQDTHMAAVSSGLRTSEKLDEVWAEAERLQLQTPRSFALRLSRVLESVSEKRVSSAPEAAWSERVLAQVEKERYFILLPGEVASHCAQSLQADGKSASSRVRLLLLDIRPESNRLEYLPQALHFYPPCLHRLVTASSGWAHLERLAGALSTAVTGFLRAESSGEAGETNTASNSLHMSDNDTSLIDEVFLALEAAATERWGKDCFSASACAHLVLLGDGPGYSEGAIAPVYDLLVEHRCLARISVALGGAVAVNREAVKRGVKLEESPPLEPAANTSDKAETFLGTAWSKLQAASDSLPPASDVGGRLEGLFQGIAERTAVVRQHAAEGAAAVRQQAAEGMSVVMQQLDKLDREAASETQDNQGGHPLAPKAEGE